MTISESRMILTAQVIRALISMGADRPCDYAIAYRHLIIKGGDSGFLVSEIAGTVLKQAMSDTRLLRGI